MRYWLDSLDRIAAVDGEWRAFAVENGAEELTEESVVGRSVFSFIADESVRHLWALLLRRARQGVVVQVPIRCDSPDDFRALELVVTMDGPDLLLVTTSMLFVVPRPSVRLLRKVGPRSTSSVRICSWCKRIEVPVRGWCEVEEAAVLLEVLTGATPPGLEQGSCLDCYPSIAARAGDAEAGPSPAGPKA
ncbi:MAG: hypothetical protein IPP07_13345 [Holophagales bacterium]|nr:hypothetical protein [Holophagales bacterium]